MSAKDQLGAFSEYEGEFRNDTEIWSTPSSPEPAAEHKSKPEHKSKLESEPKLASDDDLDLQDGPLKLQVGERHFNTTASTLKESNFFKSMLSGRWNNAHPNGSFYVDRDGDLFAHILSYLRSLVLPIFYESSRGGHDEVLYTKIWQEAKFYGIDRLRRWIEERRYLEAVQISIATDISDDCSALQSIVPKFSAAEPGTEVGYFPVWIPHKIYSCPRKIPAHMDHRSACGGKCNIQRVNAQRGMDEFEDRPFLRVVKVTKKVVIDRELCLGGMDE